MQQLILFLLSLFLGFFGGPPRQVILPQKTLSATSSAILEMPKQNKIATQSGAGAVPWGTTEKVADHLYRTFVGSDAQMGTPEEILRALNNYRRDHNRGELQSDSKLCTLAQDRARVQNKAGSLDSHKGLEDYMKDPNSWTNLNLNSIGENASYGYVLSGVHLIEWVFDADWEHRDNQLSPHWTLACAGISGLTVDIIFGKR